MYHPPDLKSLPTDLQDLFTVSTICLGDLNAKHPIWGCSTANPRGNELLKIIDDKCFSILNHGTATHFSYNYNTKEALDFSIASSDLGPSCEWTLLENLGSDHLPILFELKKEKTSAQNNEQPQTEQCNTTLSEYGNTAANDKQAADLLGLHYQKISRLNLSDEDRNIKIKTSCIVHGCRRGTSIFSRDFRVNELEATIGDSCLNKSPGPDAIHGQMIDHLVLSGRQIFVDIINCSWNKGQLPRDWRRATVIPIKKCGKTHDSPERYQSIALTSIA
ncbi:hypothetical protein TNCV_4025301 [Trichonephila clavipes]|uniref:Endonuclease/exonuclease/phosphatase domain-containing protein n=1 Tax=Trichonephila clavipes TaxID=2585209 RepID=A0A8X6WF62_TRICX|nr:hypothetical protein TNCV_4025301 [Trichonephila clavipes]